MPRKKKKKKELKPEAIESTKLEMDLEELKQIAKNIDKFDIEPEENKNETFYKLAIKELFNDKSIETKTEWLTPGEVFVASKLVFLGTYGNLPMLKDFIGTLERKRISLNRKGREEIVISLQERHKEDREIQKASLFGFGMPQ